MGTIHFCDLCGKDIPDSYEYVLPYFIDEFAEHEPNIKPCQMDLCTECAEKIRTFCKTLDHVNGYKYEVDYDNSGSTQGN